MRFVGRAGAMVLGIIGVVIGLVVNFAYSGVHDALRLGGDKHITQSHGVIGFFLIVVGLIGSLLALPAPVVSAALLLVAAIGFFFIVKVYAIAASIFFLVAAILAYVDRSKKRAAA